MLQKGLFWGFVSLCIICVLSGTYFSYRLWVYVPCTSCSVVIVHIALISCGLPADCK